MFQVHVPKHAEHSLKESCRAQLHELLKLLN